MKRAALTAVLVLFFGGVALAQSAAPKVVDLNRQAMDAYTNLELDQARALLEEAIEVARKGGVQGSTLAQTHLNLGVVWIAGFSDNGRGLHHFTEALRADPTIQLDPLTSTPEIQQVFSLARGRATGTPAKTPEIVPGPPPPSGSLPELMHTPATEQLVRTPLPVYVSKPSELDVEHMYIYFRAQGSGPFQQALMNSMTGGFGYEIPCQEVQAPAVDYYIVAYDSMGNPAGMLASAEQPESVPVVTTRSTEPPALPGGAPPAQCAAGESGRTACMVSADCLHGFSCEGGYCVAEGDGKAEEVDSPRFFIQLGFGIGGAFASAGKAADSRPPSTCFDDTGAFRSDDPQCRSYVEPGSTPSCNGDDYCVFVTQAGFLPTLAVRLTSGYWITPRFALSGTVRFQLKAGEGSLANLLLGARAEYLLTQPVAEGFYTSVFAGLSVGQIQVQPSQANALQPFIASGPIGGQLGMNIAYRFVRNFGILITPEMHMLFPRSLFAFEVTTGLETAF